MRSAQARRLLWVRVPLGAQEKGNMRFIWRLFEHEHVPTCDTLYKFDMRRKTCKRCRRAITFNGEWNYWWTDKERLAREAIYDKWLESLPKK